MTTGYSERKTLTGKHWRPSVSTKKNWKKSGDMELLLQGEETETVPLKIRTPALRLTMDATLRITVGTDGKPVMEINGISPEAESEAGG